MKSKPSRNSVGPSISPDGGPESIEDTSYIDYGEDRNEIDTTDESLTKLEARVDQQAEELALFRLTVNPPLGAHTLFLDFHAELRRLLQARSRTDAKAIKAIKIEAVEKLRRTIDLSWWGTEVEWPGDVARPGDAAICCPGGGKAFLDLVAALFAYYDNDTGTSSRSNVMHA